MPKNNAGFEFCQGLMPAAFITTSSLSDSIRLYTKRIAANKDIGDNNVKILGISKDVSFINKPTDIPLLVIRSTKRSDWVSQIIDISEKQTNKKPIKICLIMYLFSFFMSPIITKIS